MGRVIVSDEVELEVRRMLDELQRRVLSAGVEWRRTRPGVQMLIEGREVALVGAGDRAPAHRGAKPKRDYAEQRRVWCETYLRGIGFNVTVPKPTFSNRAWMTETRRGRVVIPRAPTSLISYEAFKRAVGEGDHWTVTDAVERAKIGWEPTDQWYWFWADAQDACPRLGTSWNDLTAQIRLPSLEEHTLLWYMVRAETGRMLDRSTWAWLRTRFGPGALDAHECGGRVRVSRHSAEDLSIPFGNGGGRALDVVG